MPTPKLRRASELVIVLAVLAGFASISVKGTPTGAKEQDVKSAQQALTKLGYTPGPDSGRWDAASADALRAFQHANGIWT